MPTSPTSFDAFAGRGDSYEQQRGGATKRLYDYRWQKDSKAFLAVHPLCVMCEQEGRTTASAIVDHIIPHRGDVKLFRDRSNWQPLCKEHHDSTKQRMERARRK